ncbi:DUF5718 family protein [Campylobacter hyointestinalis]|uniref:DUF5718 family protein n=1 Tax=Campylobacter hyointestinalis TaxID=198 RepID=UPI0007518E66|nr:DUF5718 family protein [Campylobacter hyointestinalis]
MKNFLGFGVVGNFAFHLEQAGEASDFVDIKTQEADAPKGIFPFYIPRFDGFLGRDCIDNLNLILADGKDIQAEPEIAIRCEFEYENGIVKGITPIAFMAFNDASVRGDKTATKISQKKNFSSGSKGFGNEIKIDKFDETGICNDYSLVSFLKSNEEFFRYGECAKISEYNYIYAKLLGWIKDTFNSQKDFSVLEDLGEILRKSGYKKDVIITIGATRYEPKGENRFLKTGDEISIVSFNHTKYSLNDITNFIKNDENMSKFDDISVLKQVVK